MMNTRLIVLMVFGSVPIGCNGELTLTLSENGQATTNQLMFEQSPGVRSISLSPGLTYKVSCGIGNIGSFLDDPWTKDSSALLEMAIDDTSGSNPQAFYEDTHTNVKDLYLYNFDSSLVGNYTCLSTEDIKSLIITANNPSVVLGNTYYETTVDASAQLTIMYSVFGDPVPEVEMNPWYFEGSPIDDPAAFGLQIAKLSPTFIIRFIGGAQKTHLGEYTIVVSSSAGTSNDSFTLQVFSTPIISISSDCNCLTDGHISVSMNSSFTISCTDTNSNPLPVFTWFKDGIKDPEDLLVPDSHIAIEKVSSTESRLVFTDTDLSHAGVYSCKANNTKQKDLKSVTVNVEYAPQVSVISALSIDVPVGEDIVILVRYQGGYPAPTVNWAHLNGTTPLSQNGRAFQSGEYYLNLTVIESRVQDGGQYVLRVDNGVDTAITLEFTVNILAPPTLIHYSNITTFRQVGDIALFIVGVVSAQPPVNLSDLSWSGNFAPSPSRQTVMFKDNEVVLELSNLQVSDTGNITLTVIHAAGNVDISFELIVLNAPVVPESIEILSYGTCHVQVRWVITDPTPSTAPVDEVLLEQRDCYHNDTDCNKEWNVLTAHPSEIQFCNVSLLPNEDYSFRLTSCNDLFGCGEPEIVPIRVESHLPQDDIRNFSLSLANSYSLMFSWNQTVSDCYLIVSVICKNVQSDHVSINEVMVTGGPENITITSLEPDSNYTCTIAPSYTDALGNTVILNTASVNGIGLTQPTKPNVQAYTQTFEGALPLTVKLLYGLSTLEGISHVQIAVLRLQEYNYSIPTLSPDELYHSLNDFSTYQSVHSSSNRPISVSSPYIAVEFDIEELLSSFTIGEGGVDHYNNANGPLYTDYYYTVFIRLYAWSQFNRQYSVFSSSEFSSPIKPTANRMHELSSPAKPTATSTSNSSVIALEIIILMISLLIFVAVLILVILASCWFLHLKRKLQKSNNISNSISAENVEIKMTKSTAYNTTSAVQRTMYEEINDLCIATKNEEGIHDHND